MEPKNTTESAPEHEVGVLLIVNGRKKLFDGEAITFEQVVEFAFPNHSTGPEIVYVVAYSKGPTQNPEGTLTAGHFVQVTAGMVFNVTATNQS